MTRKIFALAICILTTILTVSAQTPPDNEIWYTTTDGKKAELYEGDGYWYIQIISHTYDNGKGVVRANRAIEDYGIWYMDGGEFGFKIIGNHIETITLPNRLTEIGYGAFSDCTSLTSITIPDSVTEVGESAFEGCTSLKSFNCEYASADGRCLIVDGKLIAFAPTGLTSYTIPDSVTKIGWGAFEGCTSLKSITIPDSVTEIEEYAFSGCTSLTSITIPDSVTEIGWGAYRGCTSLKSFNGKYASADGRCLIKDAELIAFAPAGLTSYTIPYGVTKIGGSAFSDCTSLTSITIPDSVTEISGSAFNGCTSLTSINIPNSVTEIRGYAFYGCTSLTSINIPNSVTEIERSTFEGCTSLESFQGKYSSADGRCLIKDGVLFAFAPAGLTSYTIPYGVTKIGYEAFWGCTSLTNITIPYSVTEIGDSAFSKCISLTNITIPDSVTEISGSAFNGCTGLESFQGKYSSADGRCLIKDGVLFASAPAGLTSYTIPDGVTEIGREAFEDCTSLTSINIPNSVTEISGSAFYGCDIVEITLGYKNQSKGIPEDLPLDKVTGLVLAENITNVGSLDISRLTNLKRITIDTNHFQANWIDLSNIEELTIGENVSKLANGTLAGFSGKLTLNCKRITKDMTSGLNLSEIVIGDNVECIDIRKYTGKYASADGRCLVKDGVLTYANIMGLISYDIPEGVTTISDEVFKDCGLLSQVTLPQSLTTIGERAFMGCGITEITIPQGVATIGQDVFKGCTFSFIINCLATIPPQIATLGITEKAVIYVPKESVKLYKKAEGWKDYKKQIRPIEE